MTKEDNAREKRNVEKRELMYNRNKRGNEEQKRTENTGVERAKTKNHDKLCKGRNEKRAQKKRKIE